MTNRLFSKRRPSRLPSVHIPQGWGPKRPFWRLLGRFLGWLLGWALFVTAVWYVDRLRATPASAVTFTAPAHTLKGSK
jgi:drug/metabolite transporter (DMT)-like permease